MSAAASWSMKPPWSKLCATTKSAARLWTYLSKSPYLPSSPLWDFENVLITPHTAGLTEQQWERQYALVAENLRRYINHQPLLAIVDQQKGY